MYRFHSLPEFKELFQDICPKKDYINPENSYLDLGNAFQTAQLFGLLTLIQGVGETRSIISCDKNMAQEIISNVDVEMADKMANLFNAIFDLDNNSKEKKDSKISTEDEGNINNQIEDYEKSLESPINKEVKGPILIKSKKKQNNQSCKN